MKFFYFDAIYKATCMINSQVIFHEIKYYHKLLDDHTNSTFCFPVTDFLPLA
ncbi:unnamed protein product [Prunus brigantina]